MKKLALMSIRIYQATRLLRAPSCRFYPSCSDYAHGAIARFGLTGGCILSFLRLLRCHPFNPGGLDEVPAEFSEGLKAVIAGGAGSGGTRATQRG